jgi:hypothetical protein
MASPAASLAIGRPGSRAVLRHQSAPRPAAGLAPPVLVAAVPPLAFAGGLAAVAVGVLLRGAAVGLQDSTVKALVADLVRPDLRATAYGLSAAVQGVGALAGGIAPRALYEHSTASLVIAVVASRSSPAACSSLARGGPGRQDEALNPRRRIALADTVLATIRSLPMGAATLVPYVGA